MSCKNNKSMSKNATIRLPEEIQNKLRSDFEGLQNAISLIVEPFDKLRLTTVNELKGYFTKEEITALFDSQNGTILTPDFIYNKSFFMAQLEDFEIFDMGISRQNADKEVLLDKIKKLSSAQLFYLQLHISIFWTTSGSLEKEFERLV